MATQRSTLPLHILKCCCCNDIPWSQVFQCTKGHTICDKCHSKVNNCPKCKIKLSQEIKIQSPFMELVLDTMDFDCPYKERGCEEKLTRNKLSSHREKCGYGPSSAQLCKMFGLSCEFSGSSDKIHEAIRHFQDEHDGCLIQDSNEFTITLKSLVSSRYLSSPQDRIFSPVIVKSGEEQDSPVFLIAGIVKGKLLQMVSLFFGDCTSSYRCRFEVDVKHLDSAAKTIWTERPSGIWSKDFDLKAASSVKVPLQVLQHYGTSNGSILVNVTISGARSEENIEVPRLQSLFVTVTGINLQQEHSSGNTDKNGVIARTRENWKGGQNPFMIKSVVKNISKYLGFNELSLCRGLNNLWNEASEEFFWKLCPQLVLFPGFGDKHNALVSKRELTISEFMKIYSNSDHPHPLAHLLRRYRKFMVRGPPFDNDKLEVDNEIAEFFDFLTKVGPQMASLELKDIQVFRNLQDCADVLSCKYTPNLESLSLYQLKFIWIYDHQSPSELIHDDAKKDINSKLHRLNVSIRGNYDDLVQIGNIPWLDVLSRYPKLKVLCLECFPPEVFENILTAIVTIRQTTEPNFHLIELEYSRGFRQFRWTTAEEELIGCRRIGDLLRNSYLHLVKLDLHLFPEDVIPGLLEDCSKTLKSLTLYHKIPQPFPVMQALKELDVRNSSDLTFLSNVPNLVSLIFHPSYSDISFPETIHSIMSLNKFQGGYGTTYYDVALIKELFSLMPNIRVLEMWLNNNSFSWVCHNLPNLKELTVIGHNLDESGVLGYIEATTAKKDFRPNITDLKELESFTIKRSCKTVELTEKSVFQGFCLMNKLSTLVIYVKSKLSAAAMRALKEKIKNVQVNIA